MLDEETKSPVGEIFLMRGHTSYHKSRWRSIVPENQGSLWGKHERKRSLDQKEGHNKFRERYGALGGKDGEDKKKPEVFSIEGD